MIKWTFFFEDGNVASEVKEEAEDKRIKCFIADHPKSWLLLPGQETDLYVHLDRVKCVARQIIDTSQVQPETVQQVD